MWDLPGPGIKPVSPELAGGFFTAKPSGKPSRGVFMPSFWMWCEELSDRPQVTWLETHSGLCLQSFCSSRYTSGVWNQPSQACLEVNTPGPIQAYWLRTQQGGWLPGPFWFSLKVWGPSVQFSRSVMSESCNPWTAACQASLSITSSWSLLKLSVMPSNHLILCHPLLLPPSVFPSISVFSTESVLHMMWPKYWSFSISPSNEYSGLISFRID